MGRINIRSPHFVTVTDTDLTSAKLSIKVYDGQQIVDRPIGTEGTYDIVSTAYNEEVVFEISELIKDFIDVTFNGTYTSQMVWVDYQVTKYISGVPDIQPIDLNKAFDGYGYFEDGANPQLATNGIFQSNLSGIYAPKAGVVTIAIDQTLVSTVKFMYGVTVLETNTIIETNESDDSIRYFSYDTAEPEDYIDKIRISIQGYDIDIPINWIEECKHTPHKITFVNKFGVLQDLWFFKRSNLSLSTKKEEYKSNILSGNSYSVSSHQQRILNKQGQEKLVLNSGFVDEQYNEVFRQLMLSEKVWIKYNSQTLPINISSSSFNYKTSLNDKMINYTINVDFAYDKINSIR